MPLLLCTSDVRLIVAAEIHDVLYLFLRHAGEHRQAQHLSRHLLRQREIARLAAKRTIALREMRRHRIMNQRRDAMLLQILLKVIAMSAAHDELMVCMLGSRALFRQFQPRVADKRQRCAAFPQYLPRDGAIRREEAPPASHPAAN